ncbi:MAG: hypothetical protein P8M30_07020 [Planctomycetaceae bacterium]|nr:hypothetical protein [Planctomycetaceae bacterium]
MTTFHQQRLWIIAFACVVLAPISLFAQSDEIEEGEVPKPVPIGLVVFSGINRGFEEFDYIFETIERPELTDIISASLSNLNDLKGIDQDRPLGVMAFLKPGSGFNIFPTLGFVGFLPCENFEDVLTTFGATGMQVAKVPLSEVRYSMKGPGQDLYFEKIGEEILITNDETLLDAELPDPVALTKTLSTRYDVGAQVNIKNVPIGMRKILLQFFRSQMEIQMQRRDEEPEGPWRMRKASLANNLHFVEQLATQGDSLTIGLDVSKELKKAVIEIDLNAKPGSQFAKYLGDSGGVTSYFRVLQDDPSIISAYMSWELQKADALNLKEIALGLQQSLEYSILEENPVPEGEAPQLRLGGLFECLAETAEAGTLDAFGRMQQTATGESVVMVSIRVINGTTASVSISDLLQYMDDQDSDNQEIQLNADSYRGVNFHRVTPTDQDAGSIRVFGENWSMYFGSGERTLWFVMGGEEAIPTVHAAIDQILDPASQKTLPDAAPFRFTLNMSQWMSIFENPERERQGFGKKVAETFEAGDDKIIADMTPRENGIRYRIRFEEGFVKLVGLAVARAFGIPLEE